MGTSTFQRRSVWQHGLIALFLCMLLAPNLDLMLGLDRNPPPTKWSVQFPTLKLDATLRTYPGQLRNYIQSNMGFRPTLVRLHGWLKLFGLHTSPAPTAVITASRTPATPWLFMKSERVLDDYRRVEPFSKEELNAWALLQDVRSSSLEEMGTHYLLVLVPNKETVYSEHMPSYATRADGPSRLTQLVNELRLHPHIHVLDLRDALLTHKAKARLYHYTDTHWNDTGAFIAYQAIIEQLKPWFPTLQPLRYEDMKKSDVLTTGGDLARICGLQGDLKEPQTLLELPAGGTYATLKDGAPLKWSRTDVEGDVRFETRAPKGEIPSVVFARDSFADLLIPYLSQHFAQALWLWTYELPDREISARRPKLVIQELTERKLMLLTPK